MTDRARSTPLTHAEEMVVGARFGFGANWARFLEHRDASSIQHAESSLLNMLALPSLEGLRFLDAGSGSGLFSLAALRLGATVHAFDYDPQSVACARELRRRYAVECGQPVAARGGTSKRALCWTPPTCPALATSTSAAAGACFTTQVTSGVR